MNFASQTFFNNINHGYRAAILKKNSLRLLPFYMVWLLISIMKRSAERCALQLYQTSLSGYKHKFNCHMRTIPGIVKLLRKIYEVVLTEFIPAITCGIIFTENKRNLPSLAPQLAGLGIPIFTELCKIEDQNSMIIREHFSNRVTHQFRRHEPGPQMNNEKKQIKSMEKIDRKTFSKSYEMK